VAKLFMEPTREAYLLGVSPRVCSNGEARFAMKVALQNGTKKQEKWLWCSCKQLAKSKVWLM